MVFFLLATVRNGAGSKGHIRYTMHAHEALCTALSEVNNCIISVVVNMTGSL